MSLTTECWNARKDEWAGAGWSLQTSVDSGLGQPRSKKRLTTFANIFNGRVERDQQANDKSTITSNNKNSESHKRQSPKAMQQEETAWRRRAIKHTQNTEEQRYLKTLE